MAIIDKVQGAFDRITKDDTKVNSAELTSLQQTFAVSQLGYIKNSFYISQVMNDDVRTALQEINDELIKPTLDKSRRLLEKANVPYVNLNWEQRTANVPQRGGAPVPGQLNDQEIVLDAMYWIQMSVTAAQAGALAAVRGDIRDFFLTQRDQGMGQWRKLAMVAYKVVPNVIPPQVQVVGQQTP